MPQHGRRGPPPLRPREILWQCDTCGGGATGILSAPVYNVLLETQESAEHNATGCKGTLRIRALGYAHGYHRTPLVEPEEIPFTLVSA